MKLVNVVSGLKLGNYESFLIPLWVNRNLLFDMGIKLRFLSPKEATEYPADVVICLSNLGSDWPAPGIIGEIKTEATKSLLTQLKKITTAVFWFDVSDSSGSNQFRYIPYVDKFIKAYLLRDISAYRSPFYRDRIYSNYYHREFNIVEAKPPPTRVLPSELDLTKIQLGWSSALGDYGHWNPYLRALRQYVPIPFFYTTRFRAPRKNREIDVNMRFGANYNRATIAYQRNQLHQKAAMLGIPTERIARKQYLGELRQSKVVVSPFGWGEVCYRDYEAILNGSLLVKPDMSHMITWPPLYKAEETYKSFKWDLSDFDTVIEEGQQSDCRCRIAEQAQSTYRRYLLEQDGREAFCKHFLNIVNS